MICRFAPSVRNFLHLGITFALVALPACTFSSPAQSIDRENVRLTIQNSSKYSSQLAEDSDVLFFLIFDRFVILATKEKDADWLLIWVNGSNEHVTICLCSPEFRRMATGYNNLFMKDPRAGYGIMFYSLLELPNLLSQATQREPRATKSIADLLEGGPPTLAFKGVVQSGGGVSGTVMFKENALKLLSRLKQGD
jgi:hypothetical protein